MTDRSEGIVAAPATTGKNHKKITMLAKNLFFIFPVLSSERGHYA
jgi:hypothetical protein